MKSGLEPGPDTLLGNEYINTVGPYYYPFSNTRFYFTKIIHRKYSR